MSTQFPSNWLAFHRRAISCSSESCNWALFAVERRRAHFQPIAVGSCFLCEAFNRSSWNIESQHNNSWQTSAQTTSFFPSTHLCASDFQQICVMSLRSFYGKGVNECCDRNKTLLVTSSRSVLTIKVKRENIKFQIPRSRQEFHSIFTGRRAFEAMGI